MGPLAQPLLDQDSHVTLASAFPLWPLVSLSGTWVQCSAELTLLAKVVLPTPTLRRTQAHQHPLTLPSAAR